MREGGREGIVDRYGSRREMDGYVVADDRVGYLG